MARREHAEEMVMGTLSSIKNRLLTCVGGVAVLAAASAAGPAPSGLPQNAALVYYQACLFKAQFLKPPGGGGGGFYGIVSTTFEPDSDPNKVITSFVRSPDYQFLIELVTAASKLPQCDWGLVRRQRLSIPFGAIAQVRDLTYFLVVQGKVFACDGQYRAALENALTIRRIARHLGDETLILYIQTQSTNALAFDLIRYVLGKMPPDAETLTWLQEQLAAGGELKWRPRETLPKWIDWEVQCLQASPDVLAGAMRSPAFRKKTEGLTGDQVLERARQAWEEVFKSVLEVLESKTSPLDKSRALGQLAKKAGAKVTGLEAVLEVWDGETPPSEEQEREIKRLMLEQRNNPASDPMLLMDNLTAAVELYSRLAYPHARVRAVQGAIGLYLIKAKTGQLPQTLPADLPKDPHTGKDFEYQATEKGFILRCGARFAAYGGYGPNPEPLQFEFQVK
jgi:hypothetical protein